MILLQIALVIIGHILLTLAQSTTNQNKCIISLTEDYVIKYFTRPLILNTNGKIIPTVPKGGTVDDGVVSIDSQQQVEFICGNGRLKIGDVFMPSTSITAICKEENVFEINGSLVQFTQLKCSPKPVGHMVKWNGGDEIEKKFEIGYIINENSNRFLTLIEGYFDKTFHNTLYTKFDMNFEIEWKQDPKRLAWKGEDIYTVDNVNVKQLYTQKNQARTINTLLGSPTCIRDRNTNLYLSAGHLAANADFVFLKQQHATFYYVNAAPQWMYINAGNWKTLENNTRTFVSDNSLDITVYTGTHGVCVLKRCTLEEEEPEKYEGEKEWEDETGEEQEEQAEEINKITEGIQLYLDGREQIPVPQFFWKIIYEQKDNNKRGTAFIVVNDPYLRESDLQDEFPYKICKNVCENVKWLTWDPMNLKLGYAYCCTVKDFLAAVQIDTLLHLAEVTDLLT